MLPFFSIVLSAMFYTLAFPFFSCWYLAFLTLIPFFWALEKASSYKSCFAYGFLWGALYGISLGYWMLHALTVQYEKPLVIALLFMLLTIIVPLGLIYAGFALSFRFFHRVHPLFYGLVVPCVWLLFEYLKEAIPLLIPWIALGYAALPFRSFVQAADIIGVYGLTLLIVAINGLGFYLLKRGTHLGGKTPSHCRSKEKSPTACAVAILLLILAVGAPVVYGELRLRQLSPMLRADPVSRQRLPVLLVQGNYDLKERWSGMGFFSRIRTYIELSRTEPGLKAPLIIWPETVLNAIKHTNSELFAYIAESLEKGALLITGGLRGAPGHRGVYNTAYFISSDRSLAWYDKQILLPYSEYTPVGDVLGRFYDAPSDFRSGVLPACVESSHGRIGISICVEQLYAYHIRHAVRQGAAYLVNLSNDTWFGRSTMPYIHLAGARMRAIENRRFFIRVSNSGFSAIITPTGDLAKCSTLFKQERIKGYVLPFKYLSLYSRYGDIMLYIALAIVLGALVKELLAPRRSGDGII